MLKGNLKGTLPQQIKIVRLCLNYTLRAYINISAREIDANKYKKCWERTDSAGGFWALNATQEAAAAETVQENLVKIQSAGFA